MKRAATTAERPRVSLEAPSSATTGASQEKTSVPSYSTAAAAVPSPQALTASPSAGARYPQQAPSSVQVSAASSSVQVTWAETVAILLVAAGETEALVFSNVALERFTFREILSRVEKIGLALGPAAAQNPEFGPAIEALRNKVTECQQAAAASGPAEQQAEEEGQAAEDEL